MDFRLPELGISFEGRIPGALSFGVRLQCKVNQHRESAMLLKRAIGKSDQRGLVRMINVRIEDLCRRHGRCSKYTDDDLYAGALAETANLTNEISPLTTVVTALDDSCDDVLHSIHHGVLHRS